MKMIFSTRRRKHPPPKISLLKKLLKRAVDIINLQIGEKQAIAVSIVGPKTISRLKKDFFNVEILTDVICFDYRNDLEPSTDDSIAIDIIICSDVAEQQGKIRPDSSYSYEMILYIIHGLLHAAGENDDTSEHRKKMRMKEKKVMAILKKEFDFSTIFPLKKI